MTSDFTHFFRLLNTLSELNEAEKEIMKTLFHVRHVPKKTILTQAGETANELYFINKGLLRLYYRKEGEEITAYIFREHLFASSYDSFLKQEPGIQYLETLEDCQLLVINYRHMQELYQTVPKMHIITRKIAEQRFINAQQILSSFLLDSPEERYAKFEQSNKDLLHRVPHHIIASYLGITPVSMSRIRKRRIEQQRK